MARIRSTKPEFWDDECLGKMSLLARLTFLALKDLADDDGRGLGDPDAIWAAAHKYQGSGVKAGFKRALSELGATVERTSSDSEADVQRQLSGNGACKTCGKPHVIFYKINGSSYYWLPRFSKHQKIDRPSPSRLPAPPLSTNPRDNTPLDQGSRIKDLGSGSREDVASPPPPSAPSAGTNGTDEAEAREVDRTVAAFGFCSSPGPTSKRSAITDLRRIGLSHEFIRSIASKQEKKSFYEIIRSLEKNKAVPDFKPSPPAPKKCRNLKCIDGRIIDHERTTAAQTAFKPCPDCGPPLETKATG